MKGKRLLVIDLCLILVLAALSFVACAKPALPPAPPPAPLKIGAVFPMTGSGAHMGTEGDRGVKVWIEDLNKKGGINGHLIEYSLIDSESDATKATVAMKKLIEVDKVHAVLGSFASGEALAMQPIANEWKIVHFACCGAGVYDEIPAIWRWGFRLNLETQALCDQAFVMAKGKYGATKIGHLYENNAYGKRFVPMYANSCKKYGITMVVEESFESGGTEFSAVIGKVRAKAPDLLLMTGNDISGGLVIKQIREMGWNVPICTIVPLLTPDIVKAVGTYYYMEPGVWATTASVDAWEQIPKDAPERVEIESVATLFKERYGENISSMSSIPMNALKAVTLATKKALDADPKFLDKDINIIRQTIRDNLETLDPFWTAMGQYQPTKDWHNGNVYGTGMVMVQFDPTLKKMVAYPQYKATK